MNDTDTPRLKVGDRVRWGYPGAMASLGYVVDPPPCEHYAFVLFDGSRDGQKIGVSPQDLRVIPQPVKP